MRARVNVRRHRDAVALEWDGVAGPDVLATLADWAARRAVWLSAAWLGRPALLITQQPQSWSVAHELGPGIEVRRDVPYLMTSVSCCDEDLIALVAGSEEFDRGLLRLAEAPGGGHGLPDAEAVLRACRLPRHTVRRHGVGMGSASAETFAVENDGSLVLWFRPGRTAPAEQAEGPPLSDEDVFGL
jgi:hypothetical protein